MKISVSMIVKNEEEVLGACLASLAEADEVVILDTGSTDKTAEVAAQYPNVRYIAGEYVWEDSFCKARNRALSYIADGWVLTVDADEALQPGGIALARKAADQAEKVGHKAVNCRVVARSGGDAHLAPRLYKRCPSVYWCANIHNYLNVTGAADCPVDIRYGYSPAHKLDPDRALRILSKVVDGNPKAVREVYYLAREYWYRKDYKTAVKWIDDYLTRAYWGPEWADALLMKAWCLRAQGKNDAARTACLEALNINANFREAAEYLASMCGPKNAARWREFARSATNEDVLFVRGSHKPRFRVHYCEGMRFFGEKMLALFDCARYNPATDKDEPCFFEGLYFEDDYLALVGHRGERVVYWNGSDVLRLLGNPKWQALLQSIPARHLADSPKYVEELAGVGIAAECAPMFFGRVTDYPVSYRQASRPRVYMNANPGREDEYGVGKAFELAQAVPEVEIHVYGVDGEVPGLVFHGRVPEAQMDNEIRDFQGCLKLNPRDCFSQTGIKSILMAQHPIFVNAIDGVTHAPTKEAQIAALRALTTKREPNLALREKYINTFNRFDWLK